MALSPISCHVMSCHPNSSDPGPPTYTNYTAYNLRHVCMYVCMPRDFNVPPSLPIKSPIPHPPSPNPKKKTDRRRKKKNVHVHEPPCFFPYIHTYISHTYIHIYTQTPKPKPRPPNPTNPQGNSFHSPGRWMEYQINSPILPLPLPPKHGIVFLFFSNIYLFIFPGVGSLPITSGIGGLGGGGGFLVRS